MTTIPLRRLAFLLPFAFALASCESPTGSAEVLGTWNLQSYDDFAVTPRNVAVTGTITFRGDGTFEEVLTFEGGEPSVWPGTYTQSGSRITLKHYGFTANGEISGRTLTIDRILERFVYTR